MTQTTAEHLEHLYAQRLGLEPQEARYEMGWDERNAAADNDELLDAVYVAIRRRPNGNRGEFLPPGGRKS